MTNIWEQNIKEWYEKSETSRLNYLDLSTTVKPSSKELVAVFENLGIPDDYDVISVQPGEEDSDAIYSVSEGIDDTEQVGGSIIETIYMFRESDQKYWLGQEGSYRAQVKVTPEIYHCQHEWDQQKPLPHDRFQTSRSRSRSRNHSRSRRRSHNNNSFPELSLTLLMLMMNRILRHNGDVSRSMHGRISHVLTNTVVRRVDQLEKGINSLTQVCIEEGTVNSSKAQLKPIEKLLQQIKGALIE